jgi:hypothetical protein
VSHTRSRSASLEPDRRHPPGTLAQRVDRAISHYSFEGPNYGSAFYRYVYHSPRGLELWRRVIGDTLFTVRLCATEGRQ